MRVLIVTYNYLSGFGGGVYGARAYINAFAALYGDVTLLYPARSEGEPLSGIDRRVRGIEVVDHSSKLSKAVRLVARGIPHRFEKPFRELLERERFDLVVFQNSKCSTGLIGLARAAGARVVVQHDNFEWEYTRDNTVPSSPRAPDRTGSGPGSGHQSGSDPCGRRHAPSPLRKGDERQDGIALSL